MPRVPCRYLVGAVAVAAAVASIGGAEASAASLPGPTSSDGVTLDNVKSAPLRNQTFVTGPPEVVMGEQGENSLVDSMINGYQMPDGRIRAFMSNQQAHMLQGTSVATLTLRDGVVLDRSSTNPFAPSGGIAPAQTGRMNFDVGAAFDRCGAWLKAVRIISPTNPLHLRGWYHAEHNCNYGGDPNQTHKSAAYAESRDGGLTWTKPGWPNNQVLTSPYFSTLAEQNASGLDTGAGDFGILTPGDGYDYMYFNERIVGGKQVGVARSLTTSGGGPGTWYKFSGYDANGNALWNEPGIGGRFLRIAAAKDAGDHAEITTNIGRGVSYNTSHKAFMVASYDMDNLGFSMIVSRDGTRFMELPQRLAVIDPADQREGEDPSTGDKYLYTSVMGPNGTNQWGGTFWFFYKYSPVGQKPGYLVRRKITVSRSADLQPHAYVTMASYTHPTAAGRTERWDTASVVPNSTRRANLGLVATSQLPGTVPLYDCQAPENGDLFPSQSCQRPAAAGEPKRVRTIGYIWTDAATAPAGAIPLHRCTVGTGGKTDNYAAISRSGDLCEGGGKYRWRIGYVLPS